MLWSKIRSLLLPKQLLLRLTFINIFVITVFVGLSSWAIYNTACVLADGLMSMDVQKQAQFESTLFQYLWIFSVSIILIGSITHFYLTKKITHPLRELIKSTKQMKQGYYPRPIRMDSEGEVGELSNHFDELISQLKANELHRQKVVSDLSHEFRTPLANLNGYLRALRDGVIEGDETLYESLNKESNQLIHLVEQMEQLKEWDHISTKNFTEKSQVDINKLVKQSVHMFQWNMMEANIEFVEDVDTCLLTGNEGEISQVISNLVDNAVRYYEGIGPIIVRGECLQSEYKLSVTGPGKEIPIDEQEKIFERFYRIDPSRSREFGGTGLGLAISKEIIDHHHGKIGVTSKKNVHTFWFTLPI